MISKSLTIIHISALKMKFPSKKYIVNINCMDLVIFPKEIFKGKLQFLQTLREKCPNTELFLVRIFLYSD